ncbi:MAG: hypothetical protein QM758_18445 [Armatimonas sp.]
MQYTNPYTGRTFNNPMSSSLDTMILHSMQSRMSSRVMMSATLRKKGYSTAQLNQMTNEQMLIAMAGKKGAAKPGAASVAKKPAPTQPLASKFKPTPKRLLLDAFVNGLGKTAEEKSGYRTIFARVFTAYETEAKKLKLENDVAAAMAFNVATHYTLYHPGVTISDAGSNVLVAQLQGVLNTDNLRKASNTEKQKLYEAFVLLAAYSMAISQIAEQPA